MTERLRSWRSALDAATCPNEFVEADRLAIDASKCGFHGLKEMKTALAIAKRRMGIGADQDVMPGKPEVIWTEHLVNGLAKSIDDIEAHQNPLWELDAPWCAVNRRFELSAVSRPWCLWLGYEPGDVIGALSLDFMTDPSRKKAERRHSNASEPSGVTNNISYDLVHKDGSIVPVRVSSVRMPIDGDETNWRALVSFKPRVGFS